jgi:F-type H+-transporting ATPase subunit delta
MSDVTIASRYARALFEIAKDKQALEAFGNDLQLVNESIRESKEFASFLQHPGIDAAVKKRLMDEVFASKISEDVLSLLKLLIDRRREGILPMLADRFLTLSNKERNIVDATVYTSVPLEAADLNAISEKFGQAIGKSIRLNNSVDPWVIAGLIIRIGDRLYDGSVGGKLARFKQTLVQS